MWKVISLIFISIFCIVVILNLVRFYHASSSSVDATPEQVQMAEALIQADLHARGGDISAYHVDIAPIVRTHDVGGQEEAVIHASLSTPTSQESYLIDLDKGEIVMHSMTVYYDWMTDENNRRPPERGWFHEKH